MDKSKLEDHVFAGGPAPVEEDVDFQAWKQQLINEANESYMARQGTKGGHDALARRLFQGARGPFKPEPPPKMSLEKEGEHEVLARQLYDMHRRLGLR